jgi:hypothetical protein
MACNPQRNHRAGLLTDDVRRTSGLILSSKSFF